jgi:antitoxin (DNA-binding transcriptional repressor) of toxin-antitoxin stability system
MDLSWPLVGSYEMAMNHVNVTELKKRLGHYLRLVRCGQTVLVRDRDRVIARIEPARGHDVTADDDAARLSELETRGVLRHGRGRITPDLWARRPRTDADAIAVLLGERDDGR